MGGAYLLFDPTFWRAGLAAHLSCWMVVLCWLDADPRWSSSSSSATLTTCNRSLPLRSQFATPWRKQHYFSLKRVQAIFHSTQSWWVCSVSVSCQRFQTRKVHDCSQSWSSCVRSQPQSVLLCHVWFGLVPWWLVSATIRSRNCHCPASRDRSSPTCRPCQGCYERLSVWSRTL